MSLLDSCTPSHRGCASSGCACSSSAIDALVPVRCAACRSRREHVHGGGVLCGQTMMAAADTAMVLAVATQARRLQADDDGAAADQLPAPDRAAMPARRTVTARVLRLRQDPGVRRDRGRRPRAAGWPPTPPPPTRCFERDRGRLPTLDYRPRSTWRRSAWCCRASGRSSTATSELLAMFGAQRDELVGRSFEVLYPTHERIRAHRRAHRRQPRRQRLLRRRARDEALLGGELFWCHVTGRAVDPKQPHAAGIWSFEDLSSRRVLKVEFTAARARDRRAADRGPDQQADRQEARSSARAPSTSIARG